METMRHVLDAAWEVLYVGLLLGAGLPIIFAVGVRALAGPEDTVNPDGTSTAHRPTLPMRILAGCCFAVVLAAVALGILVIVAGGTGQVVTFDHGIPGLESKS